VLNLTASDDEADEFREILPEKVARVSLRK
jgi:hypothetical protein